MLTSLDRFTFGKTLYYYGNVKQKTIQRTCFIRNINHLDITKKVEIMFFLK